MVLIRALINDLNASSPDRMIVRRRFFTNDTNCDPSLAPAATQYLINVQKVDVLIGADCSAGTLASAPLANKAKVPYITGKRNLKMSLSSHERRL